jgi:hypothetical protein
MQTFSQDIPVSKAILDTTAESRRRLVEANRAVFAAVKALVELDDPLASNLLGVPPEQLKKIGSLSLSDVLPILQTGVAIFSLRIAHDDFVNAAETPEGADAALRALLKTFAEPVRLQSLG